MHINRLFPALAFLLVLVCAGGCNLRPDEETVAVRGASYKLRPLSESKPVDLSSVKFDGYCDETTRRELAQFLGRIPAPVPVRRIAVVWSEKPLAARIELGRGEFIFLVKEPDDIWHLRGGVVIVQNANSSTNGSSQ